MIALYIAGPLVVAFIVAMVLRWYGQRRGFNPKVRR